MALHIPDHPFPSLASFENHVLRIRPTFHRTHDHVSLVARCAAFTIWTAIIVASGGLPGCMLLLILCAIDATTRWPIRIAPRLSTRTLSDRIAWLAFSIGIWAMLGLAVKASLAESHADFRTWDEIRRDVRLLFIFGILAAALPAYAATWDVLDRRPSHKNGQAGNPPSHSHISA